MSSDLTFSLDFSSCTDLNSSRHRSFLSMSPLPSPSPAPVSFMVTQQTLSFSNPDDLLKHATHNWQDNYVTADLYTRKLIEPFIRRPFFILLRCDAPLMERFNRLKRYNFLVQSNSFYRYSCTNSFVDVSLEDFIQEDDRTVFGSPLSPDSDLSKVDCLQNLADFVNIHVSNSFPNLEGLHRHLDTLDLLHPEHLRPNWEDYFMVRHACSAEAARVTT